MKKIKLMSALLISASLIFSGCSFNQAIGNVDKNSTTTGDYMNYKGSSFSRNDALFNFYVMEFQEENSLANKGELKDDYWSKKVNNGTTTNEDNLKELFEKIMKRSLALKYLSNEEKVVLTEEEKEGALEQAKYALGQTYKNTLVDFFESKDYPLTEEKLYEYNCSDILYSKTYQQLLLKQNVNTDAKNIVGFEHLLIRVRDNADESKKISDRIVAELKEGKSLSDVAKENTLQMSIGLTSDNDLESNGFKKDVNKQILTMKKDEVASIPMKNDEGNIIAYIVVKVNEVNTDAVKEKLKNTTLQKNKQNNLDKKLEEIERNIKINKDIVSSFSANVEKGFWDKYYKTNKTPSIKH